MDAPDPEQQLLQALPELFPGDDNSEFRFRAAVAIFCRPADWSAGLLGVPVGARKAAIKAAVLQGGSFCDKITRCSEHAVCLKYLDALEGASR
jgi:hypothetical protein